ncbi:hypothetical protein PS687_05727 [Pseudomonas fluorescens]|nr:hypothetical protein PS687_05727 [Pseudomonas fluorescens]
MQAVRVFIAGDVAQFIAFGGDFSVGVVAVFPARAAGQYEASQPTDSIPLVLGQRALFILTGNLPAQVVVAIALDATIGQLLFKQLAAVIPHQPLATVIGVPHPNQLPVFVVAVVRHMTVGIGPARHVALIVALVFPDR